MPRNSKKPKKKLKTHRTGTKRSGRMRKLKKLTLVSPRDVAAIRQMLPYGR